MPASRLTRATLDGIGEDDTRYTSPLSVRPGLVYVRLSGTWAGWLTVQRSHNDGALYTPLQRLPAGGGPWHIENAVDRAWYRVGFVADGDYVSGSAEVEIAQ